MPSIKMKSKSATGCLKEKYGLHACGKSSMISKNPLSRARFAENVETGTYTQSSQDTSVYNDADARHLGRGEGSHEELLNESGLFRKQESTETDNATVDNMESTLSTGTSNIETIFSPILESIDLQNNEGSEESDDRSSCEYQTCNVSDFYISDMIFSVQPIGINPLLDNKADALFLPDYKCEDSNLLCDLQEEYMVLPFLEDALDTGYEHDGRLSEEIILDADNSSLYMAIHQLRSCNQDSHIDTYPDSDYECFDPQMYISNLPYHSGLAFDSFPVSVPNEKQNAKRITLVLDLDETLVHSTLDNCHDADFTFPVFFNLKEHTVYVKQRPHLHTFLKRVADMFEIVVFTASQSIYAKQLLDILDPEGKLISRRAYRESCIFSEGSYLKDLTVLRVDLAKVAIIDNSPQVFRLQVNNGIPIKSWFDDPADSALISLLPFLETLVDADDVRPIIARKFGNKE